MNAMMLIRDQSKNMYALKGEGVAKEVQKIYESVHGGRGTPHRTYVLS